MFDIIQREDPASKIKDKVFLMQFYQQKKLKYLLVK